MLWCKRGEAVEKRAGGGGGELFKTRPWYGKRKLGGVLNTQVHLPIIGFVPLKLLDKDITRSSLADLPIHVFQMQESSTLYLKSKHFACEPEKMRGVTFCDQFACRGSRVAVN